MFQGCNYKHIMFSNQISVVLTNAWTLGEWRSYGVVYTDKLNVSHEMRYCHSSLSGTCWRPSSSHKSYTWLHSTTGTHSYSWPSPRPCESCILSRSRGARSRLPPATSRCTPSPACPATPSCGWLCRSPATPRSRPGPRDPEAWWWRPRGWSGGRRCWGWPWLRRRSAPWVGCRRRGRTASCASRCGECRSRTVRGTCTRSAWSSLQTATIRANYS